MKWDNESIEKATSLLKEGISYKEIGIKLNRTEKSIKSKFDKLGLRITHFKKFKKYLQKKCLNCNKEITGYKLFCNNSCAAIYNNKKRTKHTKEHFCFNCNKKCSERYCSHKCQSEFLYKEYIQKWKDGENIGLIGKMNEVSFHIKKYLREKYENKCSECGWNKINIYTKKVPLQVEHIDGNHLNNIEENLTLLCPNCHSLTPTFGGRNKGNGRTYRNEMRKKRDLE